jgi:hypothetical protein
MIGRTGQSDRTRSVTTGQIAAVRIRESHCRDWTRFSVWPDALHPVSDQSPESSSRDQTCPIERDWMRHRIRSALRHALPSGCMTGHSGSMRDRTRRSAIFSRASPPVVWTERTRQPCPVTLTTASGHCFQWETHWTCTSVSLSPAQWKIGVSFPQKALNPASQARREGERNPNPSLPLKLHRLRKCANTTKCTTPCACVLAFLQSFFKVLH